MNTKSKGQLQEGLLRQSDDNESNSVTVSQIFKITKDELREMFEAQELDTALRILKAQQIRAADGRTVRGVPAIIRKLATHADAGIIGDAGDLNRRANTFGRNKKPLPIRTDFWESVLQEMKNMIWAVIAITAVLSGLCGVFVNGFDTLRESIAIIVLALIIVIITSISDWYKDSNFVRIQSFAQEQQVTVLSGKMHQTQRTSVWNLVVGDIVMLEAGMRVPADCLIISSNNLKVDENAHDEATIMKNKEPFVDGKSGDPFLRANMSVMSGNAKVLVCCVGKSSTRDFNMERLEEMTNEDTPLQRKLKNLGNTLSKYALYSSFLILIILIVTTCIIETTAGGNAKNDDSEEGKRSAGGIIFSKIPKHINLAVVLIVVSMPEALPMTVGFSLAFSVMKMYADGILIKKLDAPERLGGCEEICTGKTATLTENNMEVAYFYLEGQKVKNSRKDTFTNCDLNPQTMELVGDSIIYNSTAFIEQTKKDFVPTGNGTEAGLLKFLQDSKVQVQELCESKLGHIRATLPFSSDYKFSAVAVVHPAKQGRIAIYIKGAPEYILEMCHQAISQNQVVNINSVLFEANGAQFSYRDDFNQKVHELAGKPYRVIACAYTEVNLQEWENKENNFETPSDCLQDLIARNQLKFILIGAFALRDKIRSGVRSAVHFSREQAHMNVRMISGDHIETARAVAEDIKIINDEDKGQKWTVMDAGDFEQQIGGFADDAKTEIQDTQAFQEIMKDLKVLARARPDHKHMVVAGLRQMGKRVLVTGDGVNDVDSVQCADVGFAMGSGCSAVKEVADVILVRDDFDATVKAVKWGRNIYHNVGRFLQFQMTVNLSVVLTVAIGSPILSESPFTAGQLLWINLIMDTFAAFALATEPPLDAILAGPPRGLDEDILTPAIWRQVFGVALWNVAVMLIMILLGPAIGGLEYGYSTSVLDTPATEASTNKTKHLTMVYNTFIFLQVFNEINCRKIGRRDFNVFEGIHGNLYFLAVVGGTFAAQFVLVHQYSGLLFPTVALAKGEWGACVAVGATPLAIAAALKLTPESWLGPVQRVRKIVDENAETAPSALVTAYEKAKKAKVTDFAPAKKKAGEADDDFHNV